MTLEITRTEWHPERILRPVAELEREANRRAGTRLLELADPRVPYDTGELAESRDLVETDAGVAVGYTADHARFVHGKGVALGGRSATWLEDAVDAGRAEIGEVYEDTFRSGWPTG